MPSRQHRTPDAAVAELQAAQQHLEIARTNEADSRWWRRQQATQDLWDAEQRYRDARADVVRQRVGADPHRWGLLSDDLENTIDEATKFRSGNPELATALKTIHRQLLHARLEAHRGDRTREHHLTQALAACLNLDVSDNLALRILHHLPGCARPIPPVDIPAIAQTPGGIGDKWFHRLYFGQQGHPDMILSTLSVSFINTDQIKLHDIHVLDEHRSQGLGTAALHHLCRCADHYQLRITGEIMPKDRTEESAARLATWYRHHEFNVTQTTPGQWLSARLDRQPERDR